MTRTPRTSNSEIQFLPAATFGAVRSTGAKVRSAYIVLVEEVNCILICPDEVLLLVPPASTQWCPSLISVEEVRYLLICPDKVLLSVPPATD